MVTMNVVSMFDRCSVDMFEMWQYRLHVCVCVWKKALASTCLVDMCEMLHHMEYTMSRGHDRNVAAIGRLVYVGIGALCSVDTVENCTR